jgi:hypothetical protein
VATTSSKKPTLTTSLPAKPEPGFVRVAGLALTSYVQLVAGKGMFNEIVLLIGGRVEQLLVPELLQSIVVRGSFGMFTVRYNAKSSGYRNQVQEFTPACSVSNDEYAELRRLIEGLKIPPAVRKRPNAHDDDDDTMWDDHDAVGAIGTIVACPHCLVEGDWRIGVDHCTLLRTFEPPPPAAGGMAPPTRPVTGFPTKAPFCAKHKPKATDAVVMPHMLLPPGHFYLVVGSSTDTIHPLTDHVFKIGKIDGCVPKVWCVLAAFAYARTF